MDPEKGLPVRTEEIQTAGDDDASRRGGLAAPSLSGKPLPQPNPKEPSQSDFSLDRGLSEVNKRVAEFDSSVNDQLETLKDVGAYEAVEMLHRHNVLWSRAELFKHYLKCKSDQNTLMNSDTLKAIRDDLNHYCKYSLV